MAVARKAQVVTTPRIGRNPAILGEEPTAKGTRVPVRSVVVGYGRHRDIDRVCAAYSLDAEAVQQALAFYAAHREEIDWHMRENERLANSAG